jgi:hypothetical protein
LPRASGSWLKSVQRKRLFVRWQTGDDLFKQRAGCLFDGRCVIDQCVVKIE